MDEAADRLVVEGIVEVGDQRGRTLGYPTANISVTHDALRRDGVWAGLVHLLDEPGSQPLVCAVSVGRRPTFYDKFGPRLLEAHLIGFRGDLYGRRVKVELRKHLRPMRAFDGVDGLVRQLSADVVRAEEWAICEGLGALLSKDGARTRAALAGRTPRDAERSGSYVGALDE